MAKHQRISLSRIGRCCCCEHPIGSEVPPWCVSTRGRAPSSSSLIRPTAIYTDGLSNYCAGSSTPRYGGSPTPFPPGGRPKRTNSCTPLLPTVAGAPRPPTLPTAPRPTTVTAIHFPPTVADAPLQLTEAVTPRPPTRLFPRAPP